MPTLFSTFKFRIMRLFKPICVALAVLCTVPALLKAQSSAIADGVIAQLEGGAQLEYGSLFTLTNSTVFTNDGTMILGDNLVLQSGSRLINNATLEVAGMIEICPTCELVNNGTILYRGSWNNHGGMAAYSGSGTVTFASQSGPQNLHGETAFQNLTTAANADLMLHDEITVNGTLTLNTHSIQTQTNRIILGPAASIVGEADNSRVIGTIEADRFVIASSTELFGNIGYDLTVGTTTPGQTRVVRHTGSAVTGTVVCNNRIEREFNVFPANNTGLNASVVFNYLNAEVVGPEGDLGLFGSLDSGATWNGITSQPDIAANTQTSSGWASLGYVTLSDNQHVPISSNNTLAEESCYGNDGSIQVQPVGGQLPYQFEWDANANMQTTGTATGLKQNTYSVTVTDANGCMKKLTASIGKPACDSLPWIKAKYCGDTLVALNSYIHIQTVSVGNRYAYMLISQQSGDTLADTTGNQSFYALSFVPGIANSTTYTIRVKASIGGTWGEWGPPCEITTPTLPTSRLKNCNTVLANMSQYYYAQVVPGAQRYQFMYVDTATSDTLYGFSWSCNGCNFTAASFAGLNFSTNYQVQVRAKVGGVWGNYGIICWLSTPGIPVTQPNGCPIALPTLNQYFSWPGIANATSYRHRIHDPATGQTDTTYFGGNTYYSLYFAPNIQPSTTYEVAIAAYVNNVWQPFGPICNITTPAFKAADRLVPPRPLLGMQTSSELKFFPNPTSGRITVIMPEYSDPSELCQLSLFDLSGRLLWAQNRQGAESGAFEVDLRQHGQIASGMYLLQLSSVSGIRLARVLVQ